VHISEVEFQKPIAHVQKPAEIEHVAGDVSKNGAEVRATHAQPVAQQGAAYDHGPQAETVEEAARDVGKWLNERPNRPLDLRHVAMLTHHALRAQQPAPATQQAGALDEHGFRDWVLRNMPDDTIIGSSAWWADHLTARAKRFVKSAPQPSPTARAASSAVLQAIREANMQLVRTADDAFMLVPYKVATAQAAESVQDLQSVNDAVTIELLNERVAYLEGKLNEVKAAESVPAPDDRDPDGHHKSSKAGWALHGYRQGTKEGIAFLRGARWWHAARAPAESVGRDAERQSAMFTAQQQFLEWNREQGSERPILESVEYAVCQKAIDLFLEAMAANGGNK